MDRLGPRKGSSDMSAITMLDDHLDHSNPHTLRRTIARNDELAGRVQTLTHAIRHAVPALQSAARNTSDANTASTLNDLAGELRSALNLTEVS